MSKQRRLDDSTQGPMQLVSSDQQRRALNLILKIVVGEEAGGSASFLPSVDEFSNMATAGGWCEGLEQDCYALEPVDVLGEVSECVFRKVSEGLGRCGVLCDTGVVFCG